MYKLKGWDVRFKGFGSGTVHALLAMISALFLTEIKLAKKINFVLYSSTMGILCAAILATQSRGVVASFVVFMLILLTKKFKSKLLLYVMPIFFIFAVLPVGIDYEDIPVLRRFNPDEFEDIERFTSGRIVTQRHIISWFQGLDSYPSILFGAGLNKMKDLPEKKGLEFPHFDPLYVLYEGGVALLVLYLYFMFRFVFYDRSFIYPFTLLLSALHSNMLTSPNLIFFIYLLSLHSRILEVEESSSG